MGIKSRVGRIAAERIWGNLDLGPGHTINAPGGYFGPPIFGLGGVAYYVDGVDGDDSKDGLSWANAVKTIQQAIDLNDATIDWGETPKKYNAIYVKPGVYAENLSFPYYCWIIGLGIRGTDTMTEIHPTSGSAFAGTMLGTGLYNLRFKVDEAVPMLDVGICNNSWIEQCTFTCNVGAAVHPTGIDTETCTHLTVIGCSFQSEGLGNLAYGLAFHGGADKYAHNVRIYNNVIFADIGIWVEDICTDSQAVFAGNQIVAVTIGIDDNNGAGLCINNFIQSADAIDHAGGANFTIGNRVVEAGVGAWEV